MKDNILSHEKQAVLRNASLTLWPCLDLLLISAVCMQACSLQGNIRAGPSSYEQGVHRLGMYKAKHATGQFTCKYSSSTLLNHGVNALNTPGALPAVWFAGLSVLTPPKSAPKIIVQAVSKA